MASTFWRSSKVDALTCLHWTQRLSEDDSWPVCSSPGARVSSAPILFSTGWRNIRPIESVVLDALTYAGILPTCSPVQKRRDAFRSWEHLRHEAMVLQLLWKSESPRSYISLPSPIDEVHIRPDAFIEASLIGTHSLLKAARKAWLQNKSIAVSPFPSCLDGRGVRGHSSPVMQPSASDRACAPELTYTRRVKQHPTISCARTTKPMGFQVIASSFSNNYGPYQFPEKLIPRRS